ncbi:MAG: DNA-processing protein DprA [Clostridia bacterium]|jgi:DNA processing protein
MNDQVYWVWFSMLNRISPQMKISLIRQYENPYNLWTFFKKEHNPADISPGAYRDLVSDELKKKSYRTLKRTLDLGIGIISYNDKDYPPLLKQIPDPPVVLYFLGNKAYLKNCFAIVGSRKATIYGKNSAMEIASYLAEQGIVIASGLAKGIDTYAHKGALKAGGKTVAVLASGVNVVYPYENKALYSEIIDQGTVLSEHPVDTQPLPYYFPLRNRIVSGLSKGILVIEAGEKSGTLITVDYALAQGREVFALPGNVTSSQSKGTNRLIYHGATPAIDPEDILRLYRWDVKNRTIVPTDMDESEKIIYDLVYQGISDFESISEKAGFDRKEALAVLLSLELKLYVKRREDGGYIPF